MKIKELIRAFLATAVAIITTALILPGVDIKFDFITITITVLILGLVNILLKPLIKLIALPINFMSLGLFNIIINSGLLYLVSYLVEGFNITGGTINSNFAGIIIQDMYLPWYWMLLLATVSISLLNWVLRKLVF